MSFLALVYKDSKKNATFFTLHFTYLAGILMSTDDQLGMGVEAGNSVSLTYHVDR